MVLAAAIALAFICATAVWFLVDLIWVADTKATDAFRGAFLAAFFVVLSAMAFSLLGFSVLDSTMRRTSLVLQLLMRRQNLLLLSRTQVLRKLLLSRLLRTSLVLVLVRQKLLSTVPQTPSKRKSQKTTQKLQRKPSKRLALLSNSRNSTLVPGKRLQWSLFFFGGVPKRLL